MSYNSENGYTPLTFNQVMEQLMVGVNNQFNTNYTMETFVGTNWYKYMYSIAQKIVEGEVKTSEIFYKMQQYIELTNQKIQRPSVSNPGIIDSFLSQGFIASVKPSPGELLICVDVDDDAEDYATTKSKICHLIKDYVAAGIVADGQESGGQYELITLSNGQSFNFGFYLPNEIPVIFKATFTVSDNNLLVVPDDETIRQEIHDRIKGYYKLGLDFEPQRYVNLGYYPWAATAILEWSDDDGANWYSTVYEADYDDKFTFNLEDIQVVFA